MDKKTFYSRTMHTPDDPARAEKRAALRDVSKVLIPLHKALIDAARDDYTALGMGEIASPTQLLRLIQEDPFFAWLKPITSLIVDIDEMARTDFTPDEAEAIGNRLDALFGGNAAPDFAERYLPLLQREVDVAIGHAAARRALDRLKTPPQ